MLIQRIKENELLKGYIINECTENEVSTSFDNSILETDYVILKVDDFYNNLKLGKETPPSPDCLIVLKCDKTGHSLTIIELKSITSAKGFTTDNLCGKFRTCIDDFISIKFKELLYIDYKKITLLFVSNIEIYKRDLGLKMEFLMSVRIKYKDKYLMITPIKPIPTIKKCY